jgi:ubiquinone/menaquinone biosynthesis C-methylase UbiE
MTRARAVGHRANHVPRSEPDGAGDRVGRFDAQAREFDARAGLPAHAASAVAEAVLAIAAPGRDDLLVELGAGTGQIGQHLAEATRYVGIDGSSRMIEVFREKLDTADVRHATLLHADADRYWPLGDGSVATVFASRVVHLLDAEHLVAELQRVCRAGSYFLAGRVTRDPDSLKGRLRRQRRLLLRKHVPASGDAENATQTALELLVASGAGRVEARPVATWTVAASAREVLAQWGAMGAGGQRLDASVSAGVLAELECWAARELGDPRGIAVWEERYTLEGVRIADERHATSGVQ